MKYSKKAYPLAEEELSKRRNAAEDEQKQRFQEISAISPEIVEIDRKIKGLNFELLKAISNKTENVSAGEMILQIKENNIKAHQRKADILKQLNYPEDYLDTKYTCEKCMDTGYVDGVMCGCMTKLLSEYTFEEMAENCEIALHDFDEFKLTYYPVGNGEEDDRTKMSRNLNRCIKYANDFTTKSNSIFMIGNTGLGKTMLCSCIAKKVVLQGNSVIFRSITRVFEDILAEHYGRRDGNTLDELKMADLVILDDLGSEYNNQSDPFLYQILNDRINRCRPTIISTNLSIPQLYERYNERIVSRLFGEFEPMYFVGNDIRIQKLENGLR